MSAYLRPPAHPDTPQNRLLAALPSADYARMSPDLEDVPLDQGVVLHEPDDLIKYVYFPGSAMISLVKSMQDGSTYEVGVIGGEGMLGVPVVLDDVRAVNRAIVQMAGTGMRMRADKLHAEFRSGGAMQSSLLRYTRALMTQVAQTAACNSAHMVEERLARWLLMCHDRTEGDDLLLTQDFIAQMLGVRRSGITMAALALQEEGLIRYTRGRVTVLNRADLERAACECYGVVKAEFDRLLG